MKSNALYIPAQLGKNLLNPAVSKIPDPNALVVAAASYMASIRAEANSPDLSAVSFENMLNYPGLPVPEPPPDRFLLQPR